MRTNEDVTAAGPNRTMADECMTRHARAYRPGPPSPVPAGVRQQFERLVRARTAAACSGLSGTPTPAPQ
ncbi:MAG: hypothetical protein JWO31_2469 [Phycisphaerales bacterium]|nr:hypothetical protein [Phycisphaerales bacterium]